MLVGRFMRSIDVVRASRFWMVEQIVGFEPQKMDTNLYDLRYDLQVVIGMNQLLKPI